MDLSLPQSSEAAKEIITEADEKLSESEEESVDGDVGDGSDEAYPEELATITWQLAKGSCGKLHLCGMDSLICGRVLISPEVGVGLSQAFATERMWSPRCQAALPPSARLWLDACHKVDQ